MLGFLRPQPQQDEARETLDRAVAVLRDCQRGGTAAVPVEDVLELLGAQTVPVAQYLDPLADALTGCLPVTPAP